MINSFSNKFLLLACAFTFAVSATLQADDPWPARTTSSNISLTSFSGYHMVPLNVELMWHKGKIHHGLSAGLTAIMWDSYSWSRFGPGAGYSFMTGKGVNHFELTTGAALAIIKLYGESNFAEGEGTDFVPYGQIGYRYQKPDGKLYFKITLGFPTGLGVGAGIIMSIR